MAEYQRRVGDDRQRRLRARECSGAVPHAQRHDCVGCRARRDRQAGDRGGVLEEVGHAPPDVGPVALDGHACEPARDEIGGEERWLVFE